MSRQLRLLTFLLFAGLVVLFLPESSGAVTKAQCQSAAHYNVLTYTPTSNNNLTHWGTKASHGIWVPSGGPDPVCARASSLFSIKVGGEDNVEIGWFEDPKVTNSTCHYPSGDNRPRRLLALQLGASFTCLNTSTPPVLSPSSNFEPMNVHVVNISNCSVANSNGKVDYVDDTATVFTATSLPMCTGISVTNGERHSYQGSDTAHSEFDGLNYYGSGGGWSPWEDQGWCQDLDPDFSSAIYSPTHSEVISSSGQIIQNPCYS
jgi:hypothetical protein